MGVHTGDWNDEHVATLRRLWDAGLSATEIARELRVYSRSAILGKVNRLKLAPRRIDNARHPVGAPKPAPAAVRHASTVFTKTAPSEQKPRRNPSSNIVEAVKIAASEPGLSAKLEEPSDGRGVKFIDLENHHCRWPKGDPRNEDFMFCGETTADLKEDRPYCPFHTLKSIDRTRIRNPRVFERDAAFAARR